MAYLVGNKPARTFNNHLLGYAEIYKSFELHYVGFRLIEFVWQLSLSRSVFLWHINNHTAYTLVMYNWKREQPSSFWFPPFIASCFSQAADMSKRLQESEVIAAEAREDLPAECITIGDLACLLKPFPQFICFHSWYDFRANMQSTTFTADPTSKVSLKRQNQSFHLVVYQLLTCKI